TTTFAASSTTSTTVVGATTTTVAASAAGPCPVATGKRGRILLNVRENGGTPWDLFSVNPDGTCMTQLTHDIGNPNILNWGGSWSPDGKRIAFLRSGQGFTVMNADG